MVVYTLEQRWEVGLRCRFCQKKKKNIIFSDEAHFDVEIVAFGAQKIRTHTLKSRLIQNESLFGADFAIFLRKCARRGRYSQWRSLSGHVKRIFLHKN